VQRGRRTRLRHRSEHINRVPQRRSGARNGGPGCSGAALPRSGRAALIGVLGGKVAQDLRDDPALGNERDDAHRRATPGAEERIDLVDAAEKFGPPSAEGSQIGVSRRIGNGWPRRVDLPGAGQRSRPRARPRAGARGSRVAATCGGRGAPCRRGRRAATPGRTSIGGARGLARRLGIKVTRQFLEAGIGLVVRRR